jgi:hypothetical protein
MTKQQHDKQMAWVEDAAVAFEATGLPRMAGRVLAWLLVCEPELQNNAALLDVLGASKASLSNSTRLLERFGLVERTREPGTRVDAFRVREGSLPALLHGPLSGATALRETAERGLSSMHHASTHTKARLHELHDLGAFLEAELPKLMAAWTKRTQAAHAKKRR